MTAPLRLIAQDEEDLGVISAALQDAVADLGDGVLQGGGDDLQILRVLGQEPQGGAHSSSLMRRMSAPQADSFCSSRSKPRSRW